ncbi:transposase [Roseovarius sp. D22-M7]|uniref:transposase n=1 Tax=Roseovarius sp. D22-M7 TaxID=3127116 RepID=UPI003FA7E0A2
MVWPIGSAARSGSRPYGWRWKRWPQVCHDAQSPFGGPEAVRAYLSRYTPRVAICNTRLVRADAHTVAFRWTDCRIKSERPLESHAVVHVRVRSCRFPTHILPHGFRRIWPCGLVVSAMRKANIIRIRALLRVQQPGTARMTYRPSSVAKQHRLHAADPVRTACALIFAARPETAKTQERMAWSGSSTGVSTDPAPAAPSTTPRVTPPPTVRAVSPCLGPRPPMASSSRGLPARAAHAAPRPAS